MGAKRIVRVLLNDGSSNGSSMVLFKASQVSQTSLAFKYDSLTMDGSARSMARHVLFGGYVWYRKTCEGRSDETCKGDESTGSDIARVNEGKGRRGAFIYQVR